VGAQLCDGAGDGSAYGAVSGVRTIAQADLPQNSVSSRLPPAGDPRVVVTGWRDGCAEQNRGRKAFAGKVSEPGAVRGVQPDVGNATLLRNGYGQRVPFVVPTDAADLFPADSGPVSARLMT
jgi:hypothetical protein